MPWNSRQLWTESHVDASGGPFVDCLPGKLANRAHHFPCELRSGYRANQSWAHLNPSSAAVMDPPDTDETRASLEKYPSSAKRHKVALDFGVGWNGTFLTNRMRTLGVISQMVGGRAAYGRARPCVGAASVHPGHLPQFRAPMPVEVQVDCQVDAIGERLPNIARRTWDHMHDARPQRRMAAQARADFQHRFAEVSSPRRSGDAVPSIPCDMPRRPSRALIRAPTRAAAWSRIR